MGLWETCLILAKSNRLERVNLGSLDPKFVRRGDSGLKPVGTSDDSTFDIGSQYDLFLRGWNADANASRQAHQGVIVTLRAACRFLRQQLSEFFHSRSHPPGMYLTWRDRI